MSNPLDFYDGICLFCGEKSYEKWSGRDSWEACDCSARAHYLERSSTLQTLAREPEKRREKLELEKRVEQHKKELVWMERNLKDMK